MVEFDRERLGTALKAGKICADEEKITQIDAWLYTLWFKYKMQTKGYKLGRAKPSRELQKLNKALLDWSCSDAWKWEVFLICRFDNLKLSAIEWFSMAVGEAIDSLESGRKRTRQEDPKTGLFVDLYRGYTELSGKTGLSDEGPAIRFIAECAAIVGVAVPPGLRRLVQLGVAREKNRGEATLEK
jgi:hypothetical protein